MKIHRQRLLLLPIIALLAVGCSGSSDNTHTTVTTIVSPPPRQVLRVETRQSPKIPAKPDDPAKSVDPAKPLMIFNFAKEKDVPFLGNSEVVVDFSLANATLKGDGGEFRVRYIIDDEDMQYIDRWEQLSLTGWTPGKHTIRLELIGPDGWPYRNGDYNIETRSIIFR